MRSMRIGAVLVAACVAVVGCGSSTPEEPPASDNSAIQVTGPTPAKEGQQITSEKGNGPEVEPDLPGVPGSPIDYDSTLLYAPEITPKTVKESIEIELESKCEVDRCGVKVVVEGSGNCAVAIGPDPVFPGKTITVVAGQCASNEESSGSNSAIPPSAEEDIPPSDG